jgi:hypothetical protein
MNEQCISSMNVTGDVFHALRICYEIQLIFVCLVVLTLALNNEVAFDPKRNHNISPRPNLC